jgi:hypothetical protein
MATSGQHGVFSVDAARAAAGVGSRVAVCGGHWSSGMVFVVIGLRHCWNVVDVQAEAATRV